MGASGQSVWHVRQPKLREQAFPYRQKTNSVERGCQEEHRLESPGESDDHGENGAQHRGTPIRTPGPRNKQRRLRANQANAQGKGHAHQESRRGNQQDSNHLTEGKRLPMEKPQNLWQEKGVKEQQACGQREDQPESANAPRIHPHGEPASHPGEDEQ